ncbi:MAG TPA: bifunctional phosphoribosylaminoimidazolecarboxamide formyltransferase/IMP cyclohydrolase [Gemmataceae bacterium]|jgi:phosphoribosylaminoimidazolecarboxamide formyltransferase/IMP cyclohydrolase
MSLRIIRRALLSVSDKTGLIELARGLLDFQVELISTGGTRKTLTDAGLPVRDVSEVTGFPEMLDGRVKTLHPSIHGGILAVRDNPGHTKSLQEHSIQPIDLVVCNLYPFEATVACSGATSEEIIENIDIGGPSMVRSAAKNFRDVAIVTSPDQYAAILAEMRQHNGSLSLQTRERLAASAFARTAGYDRAISTWFAARIAEEPFPASMDLRLERRQSLRYGENPHQRAAFYVEADAPPASVARAEVLHGKELSYNNLLDLDSALNLVREFSEPAAVVIKHNNPCGAAIADSLVEAFRKAYEGDPLSAFGGILGFNREVDEATAQEISEPNRFVECIIAPGFTDSAFHVLTTRPTWKKNVRLLRTGSLDVRRQHSTRRDYRRVDGGLLVQDRDCGSDDFGQLKVVTKRPPTEEEMRDLRFTWLVCKHVKSNAIVLGKNLMVVGVGAGQMSRVDSVKLSVRKAAERSKGAVLASDAFFPFRDNVDEAARAGVTAIIQPGGSVRDTDSIQACDEHDLAMVFTGIRHFRH